MLFAVAARIFYNDSSTSRDVRVARAVSLQSVAVNCPACDIQLCTAMCHILGRVRIPI